MKELNYKGKEFLYQINRHDCGPYGASDCFTTDIFIHDGKGERKKFYLWGPTVRYDKYKKLFTLQFSIESCLKTKEEIHEILDKNLALIDRCKEIKNGEIV